MLLWLASAHTALNKPRPEPMNKPLPERTLYKGL